MLSKDQFSRTIGVAGTGFWGKNLACNYNELGALHSICDTDHQLLQAPSKKYPGTYTTTNIHDLFEDPDIKDIVIALPAEMHFRFTWEALVEGKHVFVEKPLWERPIGSFLASRTSKSVSPSQHENVVPAGVFIGKSLIKFCYGHFNLLGH